MLASGPAPSPSPGITRGPVFPEQQVLLIALQEYAPAFRTRRTPRVVDTRLSAETDSLITASWTPARPHASDGHGGQ